MPKKENESKKKTISIPLLIIIGGLVFLVIIHFLFKIHAPCLYLEAVWGAGDIITFMGTISLGAVAVWQTKRSHDLSERLLHLEEERQEPLLSMRLDEIGGILYLSVENSGHTAAKSILISITAIDNNGDSGLFDSPFEQPFELYPAEKIQRQVAIWGASMATGFVIPTITMDVEYSVLYREKPEKYSRTVSYSKCYDAKVYANVEMDTREFDKSISSINRANVRIANYLDGAQISAFDNINFIGTRSIRNDICEAIRTAIPMPVRDANTTILESLNNELSEIKEDNINEPKQTPPTNPQPNIRKSKKTSRSFPFCCKRRRNEIC